MRYISWAIYHADRGGTASSDGGIARQRTISENWLIPIRKAVVIVDLSNLDRALMRIGHMRIPRSVIILIIVLVGLSLLYYVLSRVGLVDIITEPDRLIALIHNQGLTGVLLIIGLMSIAIILNPIPSAPIAIVSGAIYGHTWGTLYIVIGAEIGALIAFYIARMAGRDITARLIGRDKFPQWIGTQNAMTLTVLLTRLAPFISFDWVSYGAGLTPIHAWRFALATFIGLMPASFLLAHFGSEMANDSFDQLLVLVGILGLFVLLPLFYGLYRQQSVKPLTSKEHD